MGKEGWGFGRGQRGKGRLPEGNSDVSLGGRKLKYTGKDNDLASET